MQQQQQQNQDDYLVRDHGSIWIVVPTSGAAEAHLRAIVDDEAQWMAGAALAIEPRYVLPLLEGLENGGWTIDGPPRRLWQMA